MLMAYLNYPTSRVTVHHNPECDDVREMRSQDQREVLLNPETISLELARFEEGEYRFAAEAGLHDMWLKVDFADAHFERAMVDHIRRVLGGRYEPFDRAEPNTHC